MGDTGWVRMLGNEVKETTLEVPLGRRRLVPQLVAGIIIIIVKLRGPILAESRVSIPWITGIKVPAICVLVQVIIMEERMWWNSVGGRWQVGGSVHGPTAGTWREGGIGAEE